jgi:hypothetical protein
LASISGNLAATALNPGPPSASHKVHPLYNSQTDARVLPLNLPLLMLPIFMWDNRSLAVVQFSRKPEKVFVNHEPTITFFLVNKLRMYSGFLFRNAPSLRRSIEVPHLVCDGARPVVADVDLCCRRAEVRTRHIPHLALRPATQGYCHRRPGSDMTHAHGYRKLCAPSWINPTTAALSTASTRIQSSSSPNLAAVRWKHIMMCPVEFLTVFIAPQKNPV